MTTYVFRDGKVVAKTWGKMPEKSDFPAPRVSRFEAYESPATGENISSDRQRERDLAVSDCHDPRDHSGGYSKGREAQLKAAADANREPRQPDLFD